MKSLYVSIALVAGVLQTSNSMVLAEGEIPTAQGTGLFGANRRVLTLPLGRPAGFTAVRGTFSVPTVLLTYHSQGWPFGDGIFRTLANDKPTMYLGCQRRADTAPEEAGNGEVDAGIQYENRALPRPGGGAPVPPGWSIFIRWTNTQGGTGSTSAGNAWRSTAGISANPGDPNSGVTAFELQWIVERTQIGGSYNGRLMVNAVGAGAQPTDQHTNVAGRIDASNPPGRPAGRAAFGALGDMRLKRVIGVTQGPERNQAGEIVVPARMRFDGGHYDEDDTEMTNARFSEGHVSDRIVGGVVQWTPWNTADLNGDNILGDIDHAALDGATGWYPGGLDRTTLFALGTGPSTAVGNASDALPHIDFPVASNGWLTTPGVAGNPASEHNDAAARYGDETVDIHLREGRYAVLPIF